MLSPAIVFSMWVYKAYKTQMALLICDCISFTEKKKVEVIMQNNADWPFSIILLKYSTLDF